MLTAIQQRHVLNSLFARGTQPIESRRDVDEECNHPPLGESISAFSYQQLFDREPIPNRVVQVLPRESWQVAPTVYEVEKADTKTPFETAWDGLGRSLRGQSYYQDEQGSPIWEHLLRADILSGIGQYGVLLLGLDDGLPLDQPVRPRPGQRLLFMRAFPETLAPITRYESDPSNPRFGQPTEYSVTFNDPRNRASGVGLPSSTVEVHWSRCLHLADNVGSSEVFGTPRMQPVYNRLLDLRKLYGGSAEMYWTGALPGWVFKSQPTLGGDVDIDLDSVKDEFENWRSGLQRFLTLTGLDPVSLAPQVVDPTPQIAVQIEAICVQLGIPIRVFKGSERGELASSQDDATWNDRLRERQSNHITPRIIVPFVDRLIGLGVLPAPQGYSVCWPDLDSLTDQDRAGIAVQRTNALALYIQSGASALIGPAEFLTLILGMTDAEAAAVLASAGKAG